MLRPASRRAHGTAAVTGWVLLLVTAVWWGQHLLPEGRLNVHAPPFQGYFRVALLSVVPAALFALVAIVVLPIAARVLPWGALLLLSWASAATWAVLLALWDGHPSLARPIARHREYVPAVSDVGNDPLTWLSTFAEQAALKEHPLHVNGHPPLMVLVLWIWDRLGFSGPQWAAALVIGAGASAVVAAAIVLRALGDEQSARAALPFLVLAPFAITIATSADAFFLGTGAWAAAAVAVGLRRGSLLLLGVGGLLAGSLPYLSYGLLPLGAVLVVTGVLAVRARGRTIRHQEILALLTGLVVVPLLLTAGGFWWPDGVAATHQAWAAGSGDNRPYVYSFVANFAVLGVLVGPATAAAVVRRPPRAPVVLASAALVGVLALALSGVTRLEVERIWLPFAPWLVTLCAALPRQERRRWLAVNAVCALAFQALVLDVW